MRPRYRASRSRSIENLANFTSESPQPSLSITRNGILTYANAASLPILALWGCRVGAAVPEEWRRLVKEVFTSGLRENIEVECRGRIYSFVMVPIKKDSYVNMYGGDITERSMAMERLKEAYAELKDTQSRLIQAEKMQVIGTLASSVAHELKNPLATILQGINYLSRNVKTDNKDINSVMNFIDEAIRRADGTIKNLLDFSGLSLSDVRSEDLNAVIEKSLSFVKHESDRRGVSIVMDLGKSIPHVKIDKNKIEQVFVNIFLNSIEAMPEGGELKIKTYSEKTVKELGDTNRRCEAAEIEERIVATEIEDTGEGIPPGILDKIFAPFFTTKRANGGTGLGLSIVKSIIDMHDGTIEIKNKETRGVRTRVTFKA